MGLVLQDLTPLESLLFLEGLLWMCDLSWAVLLMALEAAVGKAREDDTVGQGAYLEA